MNLMDDAAEKFYNDVYTILVEHGGAKEHDRESFVSYGLEPDTHFEWRFGGLLGMGGKCRRRYDPRHMKVDCYPEDETPKRKAICATINELLAKLGTYPDTKV